MRRIWNGARGARSRPSRPGSGADAGAIGNSLEQLATCYDPIGLGTQPNAARLPYALACLKLLRQEAAALPTEADERAPGLLHMLVSTADMTLRLAETALTEARRWPAR